MPGGSDQPNDLSKRETPEDRKKSDAALEKALREGVLTNWQEAIELLKTASAPAAAPVPGSERAPPVPRGRDGTLVIPTLLDHAREKLPPATAADRFQRTILDDVVDAYAVRARKIEAKSSSAGYLDRLDLFDLQHLKDPFEKVLRELERHSPDTAQHARRVTHFAVLIAEQMKPPLSTRDIERLKIAAIMHCVGKREIPHSILYGGKLDEKQRKAMDSHAEIGRQILKDLGCPSFIYDAAAGHHEKWDGSGYPRQLKGERIPWESRILAAADRLDAMTSERPGYRNPPRLPVADSYSVLASLRGRELEPAVCDALSRIDAEKAMQVICCRDGYLDATLEFPELRGKTLKEAVDHASAKGTADAVDKERFSQSMRELIARAGERPVVPSRATTIDTALGGTKAERELVLEGLYDKQLEREYIRKQVEVRELKPEYRRRQGESESEHLERLDKVRKEKGRAFTAEVYEDVTREMRVYKSKTTGVSIIVPEELAKMQEQVRALRIELQQHPDPRDAAHKAARAKLEVLGDARNQPLPEEVAAYYERVPEPGLVKEIMIHDRPCATDAQRTLEYRQERIPGTDQMKLGSDEVFHSAGTADTSRGRINIFLLSGRDHHNLSRLVGHEWAHFMPDPRNHGLFAAAAVLESRGFFTRDYARFDDGENLAVHYADMFANFGADPRAPSNDVFERFCREAPLRATAMAEMVKDSLRRAEAHGKGTMHDAMMKRVRYVEEHVKPKALKICLDELNKIPEGDNVESMKQAVEVLGCVGDKTHVEMLLKLAKGAPDPFLGARCLKAAADLSGGNLPLEAHLDLTKPGSSCRLHALEELGRHPDPRAKPYLYDRIKDGTVTTLCKDPGISDAGASATLHDLIRQAPAEKQVPLLKDMLVHLGDVPVVRNGLLLSCVKDESTSEFARKQLEANPPIDLASRARLEALRDAGGSDAVKAWAKAMLEKGHGRDKETTAVLSLSGRDATRADALKKLQSGEIVLRWQRGEINGDKVIAGILQAAKPPEQMRMLWETSEQLSRTPELRRALLVSLSSSSESPYLRRGATALLAAEAQMDLPTRRALASLTASADLSVSELAKIAFEEKSVNKQSRLKRLARGGDPSTTHAVALGLSKILDMESHADTVRRDIEAKAVASDLSAGRTPLLCRQIAELWKQGKIEGVEATRALLSSVSERDRVQLLKHVLENLADAPELKNAVLLDVVKNRSSAALTTFALAELKTATPTDVGSIGVLYEIAGSENAESRELANELLQKVHSVSGSSGAHAEAAVAALEGKAAVATVGDITRADAGPPVRLDIEGGNSERLRLPLEKKVTIETRGGAKTIVAIHVDTKTGVVSYEVEGERLLSAELARRHMESINQALAGHQGLAQDTEYTAALKKRLTQLPAAGLERRQSLIERAETLAVFLNNSSALSYPTSVPGSDLSPASGTVRRESASAVIPDLQARFAEGGRVSMERKPQSGESRLELKPLSIDEWKSALTEELKNLPADDLVRKECEQSLKRLNDSRQASAEAARLNALREGVTYSHDASTGKVTARRGGKVQAELVPGRAGTGSALRSLGQLGGPALVGLTFYLMFRGDSKQPLQLIYQ